MVIICRGKTVLLEEVRTYRKLFLSMSVPLTPLVSRSPW